MEWYENETALKEAIDFIVRYSCCYGWVALASNKTPCCDNRQSDNDIPEKLRQVVNDYLMKLPKEYYSKINRKIALLLGERFFVRLSACIKILCRILKEGNPCLNKQTIEFALQMQITQRIQLLKTLNEGVFKETLLKDR